MRKVWNKNSSIDLLKLSFQIFLYTRHKGPSGAGIPTPYPFSLISIDIRISLKVPVFKDINTSKSTLWNSNSIKKFDEQ